MSRRSGGTSLAFLKVIHPPPALSGNLDNESAGAEQPGRKARHPVSRTDELITSSDHETTPEDAPLTESIPGEEPTESAVAAKVATGGESLERYLREVSQWSLLTAEAERDLARRIAKGDTRALDEMISRNLRLVVYWAKRYRSGGLPIQDLIQEGNIGLIRAAEKFDPHKGTRFSTYASWWIRQALARAICDKQDLIRIPVHMHQKMRRVDRMLEGLDASKEASPDVEESVEKSGIVSFKEWDGARRLQQPISLDRRQDPSREGPIEVEDTATVSPMRVVYLREIQEHVGKMLGSLPPRHQAVLKLRYGLDDGNEHTLESIGSRLRISRERVRQIQTEAIQKIAEMTGLPRPGAPVTRRSASTRPGPRVKIISAISRGGRRTAASRRQTGGHGCIVGGRRTVHVPARGRRAV